LKINLTANYSLPIIIKSEILHYNDYENRYNDNGGNVFKIEVKIDGEHYKNLAFSKPVIIEDIISKEVISEKAIMAFRTDYRYYNLDEELSEDAKLNCVTYYTTEGYYIYQNTTTFVLCKAFHNIFRQDDNLVIEHSVGDGVYAENVNRQMITAADVEKIKAEMNSIINNSMPIVKKRISTDEAEPIFEDREDIIANIEHRKHIDIFKCGNYHDYIFGQLSYNTSVIKTFDIIYHSPGIILRFPPKDGFEFRGNYVLPRKLFATHQEHDKWLNILKVHYVSSLNHEVKKYTISDLIQIEEALHEKKLVDIVDHISRQNDMRLILVAGPSSSGKTTFAKRLCVQLRVNGIIPHIVEMDNYFLPRNKTPKKSNGDFDFETIHALDLDRLNQDLTALLAGEEVELPKFNFILGKTQRSYRKIKLDRSHVLVFEGIHGLNDILTAAVPYNQKIRIYVSALNNLNIDAHNRIKTTDTRKLRRLIRDHNFRGYNAEQTLEIWNSVREGEDKNIFPFQENADFMFNSVLTYEPWVLKKYITPLLESIMPQSPYYTEARRLLQLLDHFMHIQDDLVPNNSILREFIGGSIFKY
jgi:uridine kinase